MRSKLISLAGQFHGVRVVPSGIGILVALMLLLMPLTSSGGSFPASAQTEVAFSELEVESNFPESLVFRGKVAASGPEIVRAELVYFSPSQLASVSRTKVDVSIDAGQEVDLEYSWDTSGQTVVPNTPLIYQWTIWDGEGNSWQSDEQFVRYLDTRFNWHVEENESISVWIHDRPQAFGRQVFDIAAEAVEDQRALFGTDLAQQIQLIIYNDFAEFAEWHSTVGDFVGGQAFSDVGITTQIVPLTGPQEGWLRDVVPHEISHLYFAQATHNPTVSVPVWLNEGVASYNEFGSHQGALNRVIRAAESGELVPLSSLTMGFGSHNEARARLAYDEALSAVVFMVEEYGQGAVQELMAAYRQGIPTDRAFQQAFGMDVGTFEAAWAEWAGVPAGQYVTATPWPMPTFPASPTPPSIGSLSATPRPTKPPVVATPTEAAGTTAADQLDDGGLGWVGPAVTTLACGAVGIIVVGLVVLVVIQLRRRRSA